jgi:ring-1,2-phenylacetyl-CoA epoxidase subunit PaaB
MMDTQWPIYHVFERPARGKPMQAAGSVHAVDADMALQNAWDVFGRRPTSTGLWVVPSDEVLMKTREQLEGMPTETNGSSEAQTYCVFCKSGNRIYFEEVGTVVAASTEDAVSRAFEVFGAAHAHAWCAFPVSANTSNELPSGELSFGPLRDKWFRDQNSFPVVTMLRELRAGKAERSDDE